MATRPQAIRFFQSRAERNPRDFISLTTLGQLHVLHARETMDTGEYDRAEAAFQRALRINPRHAAAHAGLASVVMARHRFAEALQLAGRALELDPRSQQAQLTIADALMELGRYDEARSKYEELGRRNSGPAVLARLARWEELCGRRDKAIKLLGEALDKHRKAGGAAADAAWYKLRIGEMYFDGGNLRRANDWFEAALKDVDGYVPALLALGKVRGAQGRFVEAIALYEQVIATHPDFDHLGELADVCDKAGQTERAESYRRRALAGADPASLPEWERRHLVLFYCNNDIRLAEALALAHRDLQERQDIHSNETLAWALYKNGRAAEAADAMKQAMKLGTQDAEMFYHAGLIEQALGNTEAARERLQKALRINPYFSFAGSDYARQVLREIDGLR